MNYCFRPKPDLSASRGECQERAQCADFLRSSEFPVCEIARLAELCIGSCIGIKKMLDFAFLQTHLSLRLSREQRQKKMSLGKLLRKRASVPKILSFF